MEEASGSRDVAVIQHSSEDDKRLSSSDAAESSENVDDPPHPLHRDIILKLSKYLDVKTMKSARLVSTIWNQGLEIQWRKKMMLKVGINMELSIREFVKVFDSDAMIATNSDLIASNIWIQKSKFLEHKYMIDWLETYGEQLTTVQLGNPIKIGETWEYKDKHFSVESITSLLTCYCPNIKVFKVFVPFIYRFSSKALEDLQDVKVVALDHLEIGHEDNGSENQFYLTSRFLLNVLKCMTSVKSMKIVGVKKRNLHHANGTLEPSSLGDDYGKGVFKDIEELNLVCGNVDPQRLFHLGADTEFKNLQKLEIGCFCTCGGGSPMNYLPALLSSVKNQLKELIFYQCPLKRDFQKFSCPNLNACFLSPMPQLEIFKMLLIMKWDYASLDFVEKLPALKRLHITLDGRCAVESFSLPKVQNMFNVRKSQNRIAHQALEELNFRCFTKCPKSIYNIRSCFPNLKKLEMDFCGTPVYYLFRAFQKLKDLTLHLFQPFEPFYSSDIEELVGIEKLCLEYPEIGPYQINLCSLLDGCLTSSSLKELKLKGMKISKDEYQLAMEKLKTSKLQLWLNNWVPAYDDDEEEW